MGASVTQKHSCVNVLSFASAGNAIDSLATVRSNEGKEKQVSHHVSHEIEGVAASGFERVADEFERNFRERGELGAAFAAYVDGELVVDLWGGRVDRGDDAPPWRQDTLQLIFSGTKGLVATCLLLLIEQGEIALEDRVCEHWPEFAANGKEQITIAEVVSHRARMPAFRTPLETIDLTDHARLAGILAEQAPETDPRVAFAYHGITYGTLCGELVRRVDGRSVGRYFAEEVAEPLGLDLWIGLPEAVEPRVATLSLADDWGATAIFDADALARDELMKRVWSNPVLLPPGEMPWNSRAFHAAEIPAGNGIGSARSIARLYGCLARGGELDGIRLLRPETIEQGARELGRGLDPFIGETLVYATGFELQNDELRLGPPQSAFGHTGAGGSIHAAWPEQRVGASYAMNEMREERIDPRSRSLLRALYDAL
jgi:CubicO group peptidase (beta-lactamase class C family)